MTRLSNPAVELPLSQMAGISLKDTISLELEILALFDTLRLPLLRYAISFGISVADGEDILQETFLALFSHLCRNRSRANIRGWIFRVTHNLALKRRRFYKIQSTWVSAENFQPEAYLSNEPDPERRAILGERQAQLVMIYHALPQNDRLCLQLRAEGLTYREIAHVVGISLGTVSNSLVRSLARLALSDWR